MFAKWLRAGLTAGRITTHYPRAVQDLRRTHENWRTVVTVIGFCEQVQARCADVCPTDAISSDGHAVEVDTGACIGCGRCVEEWPQVFAWTDHIDAAAKQRGGLVKTAAGGDAQ